MEAWADHWAVPRVIFTDPEVASVGLTERAAGDQGLEVRTVSYPIGSMAAASVGGEGIAGTAHLVVDDWPRVVVGATFTGPDIAELLHSATIAPAPSPSTCSGTQSRRSPRSARCGCGSSRPTVSDAP